MWDIIGMLSDPGKTLQFASTLEERQVKQQLTSSATSWISSSWAASSVLWGVEPSEGPVPDTPVPLDEFPCHCC